METAITAVTSSPVITALVQVIKPFVGRADLYGPISLLLGIVLNVGFAVARGGDIAEALAAGVLAGLGASGLYSTGKAAAEAASKA